MYEITTRAESDKQNSPKVYDWIYKLFLKHALKDGNERFTFVNENRDCIRQENIWVTCALRVHKMFL